MDERTLRVLRRRRDIACVLVNPLQALHPNAGAPGDSLADRQRAGARISTARPTPRGCASCARSAANAASCSSSTRSSSASGSPPAARRSTSASRADLVTYGKTLGGGLPVGVVCGQARADEALPRRPPGRHLLRPRHLQFAPLRDGRDAATSSSGCDSGRDARAVRRPRRALEPACRAAQPAAARGRRCRCGSPT